MMSMIIAIGGGNIEQETTRKIDEYIIHSCKQENPHVLFIPTASKDHPTYIERFKQYYESLHTTVDVLYLNEHSNDNQIRSKIFASNIIYIGGGNTQRMLRIFKRYHVDEYLKIAFERNIILTGISAGAACYFKACYSDCNRSTDEQTPLVYLKGLNLLPYIACPHYNEEERKEFDQWLLNYDEDGIAMEDNTAFVFKDGTIGCITVDENQFVYYLSKGKKDKIK